MYDFLLQGVREVLDVDVLVVVVTAVPIGLVFGILPGLSGVTTLAILLPFVYGMEPFVGMSFLLAAHAIVYTGGSITAIMLGIPGAPANAATIIDGFPLSKQGQSGYAMGAALAASGLGGIVGVVALLLLLPFLQPVMTSFGSPETFCLALMGITFIAILGRGVMVKGLIAGGLGIFLALFGYQGITGVPRFWLGSDYLLDGFRLIPVVLGLFAIPEILALSTGRVASSDRPLTNVPWVQVWEGVKSIGGHPWLFLRSSVIGVLIGIVPGVGGETAPFLAYAAAKQAARNPEEFGNGAIEGVIAPESSNNAKEGGALVPTLALGIPGSAGMAVLLGGFLILGLDPGPDFLDTHMALAAGLALVLALANVLAVVLMLALVRQIARITFIRGTVLAPLLLVLVVLGTYSAGNNPMDVLFVFAFGALGWFLKELDYSRPALLLGFILGPLIETYLHISLQAYGPWFFLRPIALTITLLIVAGMSWPLLRRLFSGDDHEDG